MPIRNLDDVEIRLGNIEDNIAVKFAETTADLNAIRNDYYTGITTLATIGYVDDAIRSYNTCGTVGSFYQDFDDRISSLERSMKDIKALLMELVEKEVVSSWGAVVGDSVS